MNINNEFRHYCKNSSNFEVDGLGTVLKLQEAQSSSSYFLFLDSNAAAIFGITCQLASLIEWKKT